MKTHTSKEAAAVHAAGKNEGAARAAPLRGAADSSAAAATLQRVQQLADNSPRTMQLRQPARMMAASPGASALRAAQLRMQAPLPLSQEEPLAEERLVQRAQAPGPGGLPGPLKRGIESLSGMRMDHVKVHYNSGKPAQLQAHAYAQGSEIHVGPGQERHLPHEAWHVVQQAQGRVGPGARMHGGVAVNGEAGLEREADVMGAQALSAGSRAAVDAPDQASPTPQGAPIAQLVLKKNLGGALNPKTSPKKWAALSVDDQTRAMRLANDYYREYLFDDNAHFYDYLAGTKAATAVNTHWHKQGGGGTGPTGTEDPLAPAHDDKGVGGLHLGPGAPAFFGLPKFKFEPTRSHLSNWASFVELHFDGGQRKLVDAGKYQGSTKSTFDELYTTALTRADTMDRQHVEKNDQLSLNGANDVKAGARVEMKVNAMWDLVAKKTGVARATLAQASVPRWGQLYKGMGTRVSMTYKSDELQSHPVGSAADKGLFHPPWLTKIDHRTSGDKSYYIEGHLLNDNLGGSAAPYNLTPLTSDANAIHLHLVETFVKRKVLDMRSEQAAAGLGFSPLFNPIASIHYDVAAHYGGHARRPATTKWIRAYNFLDNIITHLPTINAAYQGTMMVDTFRTYLMVGNFMPDTVDGKLLNYAQTWAALQDAMNFVIPTVGDRALLSLNDALDRMDQVSDLWIDEEKYLPTKLVCNSSTTRQDKSEDEDGKMNAVEVKNEIEKIPFTGNFRA